MSAAIDPLLRSHPSGPIVAVDIDGVFANFIAWSLDVIHRITGRRYEHDDVTEYRMEKVFGLSVEETNEWIRQMSMPGVCASLNAYPGSRQTIDALREFANVFAVTQPFDSSATWDGERHK